MLIEHAKEFFKYSFKLLGWPFLTYIFLNIIYSLIFKTIKPKNILKKIFHQTRLFFYMLVIIIPLVYFLLNLVSPSFSWMFSGKILNIFDKIIYFSYYIIGIISCIIIIEILSVVIFDWFLAYQKSTEVSILLKDLIKVGVYILLTLVFIKSIFKIDVTTLIMSSAAISIILGLALQETLGNLFSGLALHISKPYSLGDWIKVDKYIGRVEKINWRSTIIKTFTNDYIAIPNSSISKIEIENFSTPSILHARYIEVGTHYKHPPNKIKKAILESALETDGVLKDPKPSIFLINYGDFSVGYKLRFWIEDFSLYPAIESSVMEKIWYRFKRDKIQIPFPIRDIYYHKPETREEEVRKIIKFLKKIYFLQNLTDEEYLSLAKKIKTEIASEDEIIFNQGDPGNTFYIIKSGQVRVTVRNVCGETALERVLSSGDFFGEMSLLTGEPRSAAVKALEDAEVFVLEKEDYRELLEAKPEIKEEISKVLAEHQIRTAKSLEECEKTNLTDLSIEEKEEVESLSKQILTKIKKFFSV